MTGFWYHQERTLELSFIHNLEIEEFSLSRYRKSFLVLHENHCMCTREFAGWGY